MRRFTSHIQLLPCLYILNTSLKPPHSIYPFYPITPLSSTKDFYQKPPIITIQPSPSSKHTFDAFHSHTAVFAHNRSSKPHFAPFPFKTIITVFNKIRISSKNDHSAIYFLSSSTTFSKSSTSLRPLTCHMPVKPGLMDIRPL